MRITIAVDEGGCHARWTTSTTMLSLSRVPFGRLLEAVVNKLTMDVKVRQEIMAAGGRQD